MSSIVEQDPIDSIETPPKNWTENSRSSNASPVSSSRRRKNKKSLASRSLNRSLKWIRRIHLYSGLVMFPWVILYGFTALLFNRPTTFPDAEIVHFENPSEQSSHLPQLLAQNVVDALNESESIRVAEDRAGNPRRQIRLVNPDNAVFTSRAVLSIQQDGRQSSVVANLNDRTGYVRSIERDSQSEDANSASDEILGVDSLECDVEEISDLMSSALTLAHPDIELSTDQLRSIRIPTLEFEIEIDGEMYQMEYRVTRENSRTRPNSGDQSQESMTETDATPPMSIRRHGSIELANQPSENTMTWRRYLLRLHTAHGYPVEQNARWYWAIVVDLMFASMVFWGLSGMLMWWQIKKTRRLGIAFVLLSAVAAIWLAVSMHAEMVQ